MYNAVQYSTVPFTAANAALPFGNGDLRQCGPPLFQNEKEFK